MNYFNDFELRINSLRKKIELNDDKLFYETEKGYYNILKEGRVEKKVKNHTVTIYFNSDYEKKLFGEYFKINTAVEENISGNETQKIMLLLFLLKQGYIKIKDNEIIMDTCENEYKIKIDDYINELKEKQSEENFF